MCTLTHPIGRFRYGTTFCIQRSALLTALLVFPQRMDLSFEVDPSHFHERKRRRIQSMNVVAPVPKPAPTSAPGVHEISTFLPGRLEFEHELDNEAEDLVKDMEFGVVMKYGGGQMPVDENDVDVLARVKLEEERRKGRELSVDGVESVASIPNGHDSSSSLKAIKKVTDEAIDASTETDPNAEEPTLPPPDESDDSVDFKLTLLQIYIQRVDKRLENKAIIFDRGLLEYRKVCLGLIRSHCCVSLYLIA